MYIHVGVRMHIEPLLQTRTLTPVHKCVYVHVRTCQTMAGSFIDTDFVEAQDGVIFVILIFVV